MFTNFLHGYMNNPNKSFSITDTFTYLSCPTLSDRNAFETVIPIEIHTLIVKSTDGIFYFSGQILLVREADRIGILQLIPIRIFLSEK